MAKGLLVEAVLEPSQYLCVLYACRFQ